MTGLVVNGVRTQTLGKENDDPEPLPFQTTQTRLNRWKNTRDSAYNVSNTTPLYVFSNRNNGLARRSATRVGKTEEPRVFRENFYGGQNDFLFWKSVAQVKALIKKKLCSCISHKNSSGRTAQPNHNQNAQYTFHAHYWYVLLFIFSSFTLYVRLRLRYTRRYRCLF